MHQVTERDVIKAIQRIKSSAVGADELSILLIKKILPCVIDVIVHIFNSSITYGEFPSVWKMSHIRPLPKTSNPIATEDLRPISILPALSKALEHIVHAQLTQFLEVNSILNPFQSGFRSHYSTCTALVNITDDIRSAMDNRHITLLSLLDFSKAFQTIDHEILITKLSYFYNFSPLALSWFRSYLSHRKQRIITNDTHSNWIPVPCGVPQGSILGPLLFSLYINDLPKNILASKYHLYADDVQCYISSDPSSIVSSLQYLKSDIRNICSWARENGLEVNPLKSKFIMIGSRKILSSLNTVNITGLDVNGVIVPLSESVNDLGLYINKHLTWTEHVNNLCRKTYGALHSLRRLKNFLPESIKATLVQSLVISQVDYCDAAYMDLTEDLAKRLQRIQNACVRFVFNAKYFDHLSHYYNKLGWFDLRTRRRQHALNLLYKLVTTKKPSYLSSRFKFLSDTHSLNTRSKENTVLSVPNHKSEYYSKSFTVYTTRAWNEIPAHIRDSGSVLSFRRKLNCFLSQSQFPLTH